MEVYHGSYCIVDKPSVLFSRDALDFGKGFYVTSIMNQAENWCQRFKIKFSKAYINKYDFNIEEVKIKYKVKEFEYYDNEWIEFILDCRNGSNIFNEYDVIIGGIADDKVYNTIELFQDKLIDKKEALKRLKYYKPNNQICIINQRVIDKYLKFKNFKEV